MKPPKNMPSFARKGFTMRGTGIGPTLGQQDTAAGLPKSPSNPAEAETANPMPEVQVGIPQAQNRLKQYGG